MSHSLPLSACNVTKLGREIFEALGVRVIADEGSPSAGSICWPDPANDANVLISFDSALSAGDVATLEALVAAHANDLADLKSTLMHGIDVEANRRIVELGFEYPPASGQVLSCTVEAQTKWLGAYALRENPIFTYPFTVRTKDDAIEVSIPDAAGVEACFLTLTGTVMDRLNDCRVAKGQISAAVDAAAAQAAFDAYMAG